jgi:hypothetical protein
MAAVRAFSSSLAWGTCRSGRPIGGPARPRSETTAKSERGELMASKTTALRALPPQCALVDILQDGHFQSTGQQEDPSARPQFAAYARSSSTRLAPAHDAPVHLGRHKHRYAEHQFHRRLEFYDQRNGNNTRFPGSDSHGSFARPIQGGSLREGKDSSQSGSGFATRFRDTLSTGVS